MLRLHAFVVGFAGLAGMVAGAAPASAHEVPDLDLQPLVDHVGVQIQATVGGDPRVHTAWVKLGAKLAKPSLKASALGIERGQLQADGLDLAFHGACRFVDLSMSDKGTYALPEPIARSAWTPRTMRPMPLMGRST